jgi:hypothetical protein
MLGFGRAIASQMRMKRRKWYISCNKFTAQVNTDENNRIIFAAPIVKRFMGQPFENLLHWCQSLGGFHYKEL